jgi:hypothetical protein
MKASNPQIMLDKIVGQIFGYNNPYSLDQFLQKYAFDVQLPQRVVESTTGQETWTQSPNLTKFVSVDNAWKRQDWERPKRPLNSIEEILAAWGEVNFTATDRAIDSEGVSESDNVYSSENIYRSQDIMQCKNVLFSDGLIDAEYIAASQRSRTSTYCIRLEDSKECSNSFSVGWSKRVVNSFFIQDCGDMYECMFCSHLTNKKFCIANMQYEEAEYRKLKDVVLRWILGS